MSRILQAAKGALMLDKTLKDRTDAFTGLLSQGAVLFDNTLKERTDALTPGNATADSLSQNMKEHHQEKRNEQTRDGVEKGLP